MLDLYKIMQKDAGNIKSVTDFELEFHAIERAKKVIKVSDLNEMYDKALKKEGITPEQKANIQNAYKNILVKYGCPLDRSHEEVRALPYYMLDPVHEEAYMDPKYMNTMMNRGKGYSRGG